MVTDLKDLSGNRGVFPFMGMKYNKGEFITVPNKSQIRGLEPTLQVLFMWLCDHSDNNMESFPSRRLLAEECGISVRTLDRGIQELVKLGYIVKTARSNGMEQITNLYEVVIFADPSANMTPPSAKSAQPSDKNSTRNSTHLTQSNNSIKARDFEAVEKAVSERPDLQPELTDFIEMRQAIGKPLTLKALRLINDKIKAMYPGDARKQRQCLEQSIMNGWPGVYELKGNETTDPVAASSDARYLLHPDKYRKVA
jgi:hypothetical protein